MWVWKNNLSNKQIQHIHVKQCAQQEIINFNTTKQKLAVKAAETLQWSGAALPSKFHVAHV